MTCVDFIREQLQRHGDMPFVEFMQHALYAPSLGYYSSGLPKLGAAGDFITAPELTPLFGFSLANQCAQVLSVLDSPVMLEFGAGTGKLAVDVLNRLEVLNCLPQAYWILEVSADLRARQRALIEQNCPHLLSRVVWLSSWPEAPFQGVILANEVLDAMPVHRFLQTEQGLFEGFITLNTQGELAETFKPCNNPRLQAHVERVLPPEYTPYQSEVNLFLDDWFQACADTLDKGACFIIDYGFPRHEYYHPDRKQGTLMCHYQHKAHSNPLAHPGEEDITAHVEFTHVAEAAHAAGLQVAGFTNQASFLLANGLLTLVESIVSESERVRATQAAKQLLQPAEMGELFKVIGLTKHIDLPLDGFQLHDKRASL